MIKRIILALIILILGAGIALFVFKSEPRLNKNFETQKEFFKKFRFHLGLDLSGGSYLLYQADTSKIASAEIDDQMQALRDALERRLNSSDISGVFGVAENIVRVEGADRIAVELPGVTDPTIAINKIKQTPLLEFRIEGGRDQPIEVTVGEDGELDLSNIDLSQQFISTELTGRYLKKATLEFDPTTRAPVISLQFDETGTKLFAQITKDNIGKMVAIYLDGVPISTPVVREEIPNGQAVISGVFTPDEAKALVQQLNFGALPLPVHNLSVQTLGASLGENAINAGARAATFGFFLVALFLILWYRLLGVLAVLALTIFIATILALFKLLPVTLTAAGIAGFIISIGIATDANVLIFERIKEELKKGHTISEATKLGFSRAWFSIRDSNIANILTALILFWFGTTLIKGFALTLGMGVVVSMFSAIVVTRIFLSLLSFMGEGKIVRFLFSSGITKT
ncbi:MAG: protein translocase subunit SecD [Candidatus Paceibacterota bacterium]